LINSKKAILYVHIASLVERLIRNQEIMDYKGENTTDREKPLKIISEALEVVEKAYNITVSQYELNYLYDIIYDK
jgi:sigma-54 dependent transcriptional regulator of gfr operon